MAELICHTLLTQVPELQSFLDEHCPDVFFINVNYMPGDRTAHYQDCCGLDVALEKASTGRPVILFSFLDEVYLTQTQPRFAALMGKKNVGFVRAPFLNQKVREMYDFFKAGLKVDDLLPQKLFELHRRDAEVARLKHGLSHAQKNSGQEMLQWLAQARAAGFMGTDHEVIADVEAWRRKDSGLFEGQVFQGVFVDWQGTLVQYQEAAPVLYSDIVSMACAEAGALGGRTIYICTGAADVAQVFKQSRELGLSWPVVSKNDVNGAILEVLFDNETPTKITYLYGITAQKFIQVSAGEVVR
ncbi:MAG: hypothetical protein A3F54_04400 [Candidatus Kerfeldbacteria bacterium RIFCSPHIGHO2_12_FULL_48_17]|uniref:Uncharacterized protein n=1 Tax=Candidatus Kerfeldbacteria bacterium RIFCSPHIGHO2_12_FULL_48_17 TaxID=1798542 RepID=A0A1G2BAA5_9BACT|nr:MAG: hypothetical protein A3F54_04400 [Candidatus Kerfeldbacteria bacterium RIFCSPHIGHO2_12_FULL_48_17]